MKLTCCTVGKLPNCGRNNTEQPQQRCGILQTPHFLMVHLHADRALAGSFTSDRVESHSESVVRTPYYFLSTGASNGNSASMRSMPSRRLLTSNLSFHVSDPLKPGGKAWGRNFLQLRQVGKCCARRSSPAHPAEARKKSRPTVASTGLSRCDCKRPLPRER